MQPIYHITTLAAWDAALEAGVYTPEAFEAEGFIHLSTRAQVARVANALFKGQRGLVLLAIDPTRVGGEIRYENCEGGDERFPHLYAPLNSDAVVDVLAFEPGGDGMFREPGR